MEKLSNDLENLKEQINEIKFKINISLLEILASLPGEINYTNLSTEMANICWIAIDSSKKLVEAIERIEKLIKEIKNN